MKNTFTILLLFFVGNVCFSQTWDVLSNKSYEYNNYLKEISVKEDYLRKTFEITYHSIKSEEKNPVYEQVNEQVLELCKSYLQNEKNYFRLYEEAMQRIRTLNKINQTRNDYSYDTDNYVSPELEMVSVKVAGIAMGKAFYEFNFRFEAKNERRSRYNYNFNLKHYYVADYATGTLKPWDVTLKNKEQVRQIIAKRIFEDNQLLAEGKNPPTEEPWDMEEEEETEILLKTEAEILDKIDLDEADFYWENFGLIVQFQNFTETSKLYNGKFFKLFFPLEEALEITRLIAQFSFLKNLKASQFEPKHFVDVSQIHEKVQALQNEPSVFDFVKSKEVATKPKRLTVSAYQIRDDDSHRFQNKQKYEFDEKGNIVKTSRFNEAGEETLTSTTIYNSQNLPVSISSKGKSGEGKTHFSYYKNGSLRYKKSLNSSKELREAYYFFNGNYIYQHNPQKFKEERSSYMSMFKIKEKEISNNRNTYLLDEQNEIIAVKNFNAPHYATDIARDEKGRLVETHFENDRHNFYFYYDKAARFSELKNYENHDLKSVISYEYRKNQKLPTKKINVRYHYGQITTTGEDYEWEF